MRELLLTLILNYINITAPAVNENLTAEEYRFDPVECYYTIETAFNKFIDENTLSVSSLWDFTPYKGDVFRKDKSSWNIFLKDDNDNSRLSSKYRTWWQVRLNNVDTEDTTKINVFGAGWPVERSMPVYTYDNKNWHRMQDGEILSEGYSYKQNSGLYFRNIISKKFTFPTVRIAKYYPYSLEKMYKFLDIHSSNEFVSIDTMDISDLGYPEPLVNIEDTNIDASKKSVWIHARTHPSETGSSFVAEGIINELTKPENKEIFSQLSFHIAPIVNIDGVAIGNCRTNPKSENLENLWIRPTSSPKLLSSRAPKEVKALYHSIRKLRRSGHRFVAAINLHSCNDPITASPFALTHFKERKKWQGENGIKMWQRQSRFLRVLDDEYFGDVKVRSKDTSKVTLAENSYPESWWWANYEHRVMAITLETTEGKVNRHKDWVTYEDQIAFGEAIARALIRLYYKPSNQRYNIS